MKKYFAKWLPVEGDIKHGDKAQYKTGEIIDYLVELNTDNLKKVKLFICTRNVYIGDKLWTDNGNEFLGTVKDDYEIIKFEEGGDYIPDSSLFTVIGEVSSYALWVKEGDEFEEDEIKEEIEQFRKKAKYIEVGDVVMVFYGSPLFYTEGVVKDIIPEEIDSWEWNDRFIITNARKQIGIDELGYVYEDIEDFETTRAMVSYPDNKVTVVKIKCSQCKMFH